MRCVYMGQQHNDGCLVVPASWVKGSTQFTPMPLLNAELLRRDIIASNAIGMFWLNAPTDSVVWRYGTAWLFE